MTLARKKAESVIFKELGKRIKDYNSEPTTVNYQACLRALGLAMEMRVPMVTALTEQGESINCYSIGQSQYASVAYTDMEKVDRRIKDSSYMLLSHIMARTLDAEVSGMVINPTSGEPLFVRKEHIRKLIKNVYDI